MSMLSLAKFDATPLQTEPCDYLIVPGFVRQEALAGLNADFPVIDAAGNFPFEDLSRGPRFQALVDELTGPDVRRHFAAKFGMDLDAFPTQVTIRKHMSRLDGRIHNDSRAPRKSRCVLIGGNDSKSRDSQRWVADRQGLGGDWRQVGRRCRGRDLAR